LEGRAGERQPTRVGGRLEGEAERWIAGANRRLAAGKTKGCGSRRKSETWPLEGAARFEFRHESEVGRGLSRRVRYSAQAGSWPLTQPGNEIADESRRSVPGESRRCNIRCESEVGRRCSQRMNGRRKPKVQPLSQSEKSGSGAS